MKRKCDYCHKEYNVYDVNAGTLYEYFCSEECAINYDKQMDLNPPMMTFDLPAEF